MAKPVSASSLNAIIDPRTVMAAHNNADWYAIMADLHGCRYQRSPIAFMMQDPPPPYHSWMTTLDPATVEDQLTLIRANLNKPGFGLKDGFAQLDLSGDGLSVGFEATWIFRRERRAAETKDWVHITTSVALQAWEAAWKVGSPGERRQFPDTILARSDVAIWGRKSGDKFDAGGIANRSSDCVGLSNIFGSSAFAPVAHPAQDRGKGLPLVGYERGADLVAAQAAGFAPTGPLRVWFAT